MSLNDILNNVITNELNNVFGNAMTARILMTARGKSNAPIIDMTKDDLMRLIDEIGNDQRVQEMWGIAGFHERKQRWKDALKTVEA